MKLGGLISLLLVVACVEAPDPGLTETAQSVGGDGCPVWKCGSNSPVIAAAAIAGVPFWELDEAGTLNQSGMRISGFERQQPDGTFVDAHADVLNGALLVRDDGGSVEARGTSVTGSRFIIEIAHVGSFYMRVGRVGHTHLWTSPVEQVPTYLLEWKPTVGAAGWEPVCQTSPTPDDDIGAAYAVLFDDDRISASQIATVGVTHGWFNIGCAGSALSKMLLSGHAQAADVLSHVTTTTEQRTTFLKMISADYCGNGRPFTIPGVPLHYKLSNGRLDTTRPTEPVEAYWGPGGATCLNTARIDYQFPGGIPQFPMGVAGVLPCAIASCETAHTTYITSTNVP